MKHLIYTICILSLFACTNNKQEAAQTYTPTPTGLQGIQSSNGGNTTTSNTAATTSSNANSGALNPAHGAPGHRCDIAVGAPLNSPAPTTTAAAPQVVTTQQTTAPVSTPVTPQATATVPAVNEKGQKLNPAHGMPGHKCEIEVGAPLN